MSTIRGPVKQALIEVRTHVFDYTLDLLGGVTIATAAAALLNPDGTSVVIAATVITPNVYVTIGPLAELGQYVLDCNVTCSDGEILNVRLTVNVEY